MESPNVLLSGIENSRLWAYFHTDWLLQIRGLIRPQLPPEFYVFVESETILISPEAGQTPDAQLPDLSIARPEPSGPGTMGGGAVAAATAAVVEVEEPCEICSKYSLLIRRAPENEVVAALEILSPSNKGVGNRLDLDKHLRKRSSFLEAGVNLLEIDALLQGERLLPASLRNLERFDRIAWSASHRAGRRQWRGWGWDQPDPLPVIPWTVEDGLEILLDLPAAMEQACQFNQWANLVRHGGSG